MEQVYNNYIHAVKGTTKILGIIGCPITHSLSPLMQNCALNVCGLDYIYIPFSVNRDCLKSAILGLRALNVAGFNVTVPFKEEIIPYLDLLDESASLAGAVNTVVNRNGILIGYNTDGEGFIKSLREDLDFSPEGTRIAILGAGGAARGAITALCRCGVEKILLINRTKSKSENLVEYINSLFPEVNITAETCCNSVSAVFSEMDLLVNTTSVGMSFDRIKSLDVAKLSDNAKVYDMVYSPMITPLIADAKDRGLIAVNGLGMLASQGEFAFEIWTGLNAPEGVMKAVLKGIA